MVQKLCIPKILAQQKKKLSSGRTRLKYKTIKGRTFPVAMGPFLAVTLIKMI